MAQAAGTKRVKVKKGDQVIVMAGRDKGKRGRILEVNPRVGKVKASLGLSGTSARTRRRGAAAASSKRKPTSISRTFNSLTRRRARLRAFATM